MLRAFARLANRPDLYHFIASVPLKGNGLNRQSPAVHKHITKGTQSFLFTKLA